MLPPQFQELIAYPENRWTEAPSDKWLSLCDGLLAYEACRKTLPIDKARKWEARTPFRSDG